MAGIFGSRECIARQISLIEANYDELDRYLDTVEIDSSFPSFVDECEARGHCSLNVVSDGIDYAVMRVLENHGLSRLRVKANALIALADNRYRLAFPHSAFDCAAQAGACKCAIAKGLSKPLLPCSPTILVGDGTSDFCFALQADFVFAKDSLLIHCEANAIPHLPFTRFFDIQRELPHVIDEIQRSVQSANYIKETPSVA